MNRRRLRVAREGDVADAIKRQSAMYLQRAQTAEARVTELEAALSRMERRLNQAERHILAIHYHDYIAAWEAEEAALATDNCEHEWVDARNEAVLSGELCVKCNAIRAALARPREQQEPQT